MVALPASWEKCCKSEKGDIHKVTGGAKRNQQGTVQCLRADKTSELLSPLDLKGKEGERLPKPQERLRARAAWLVGKEPGNRHPSLTFRHPDPMQVPTIVRNP